LSEEAQTTELIPSLGPIAGLRGLFFRVGWQHRTAEGHQDGDGGLWLPHRVARKAAAEGASARQLKKTAEADA